MAQLFTLRNRKSKKVTFFCYFRSTGRRIVLILKLRYATRQLFRQFRAVYIKNINYSGSLLANLNSKMQTKQHATEKHQSN